MPVVNNQDTNIGDTCFYVDAEGKMHEGTITALNEQDGNHYVEIEYEKDEKKARVTWVPHNTSPEKHSWNHPRNPEETALHYHPDFYGATE